MTEQTKAIQINLRQIVRERLGRYSRLVPGFVLRRLEKTICQDRLNELLRNNYPREGAEFCEGVLADLDVELTVVGEDKLPSPSQRRVVFVSNHPLGGLDGMALIAWATRRYGGPVHFVVNDLLNAVTPLRSVFVPVNKHGSQSRESIRAVDRAFAGDDPVLVFPAGLCSRRGSDGKIADLEWQKMFVNKAVEHHRNIVPLYFSGRNSDFFYNFAKIRKQLGLKFNIEMIYLPSEIFRARGSRFTLVCGDTIGWQELRSGKAAMEQAAEIRSLVYSLASRLQTTTE
ncbi:MAG: 1-acyl-sn-glycerol-3-phosphate acyltransferase [Muribaculaceae bacterium]|nr:1-acyl-sn-glycerol-3-phosphate acyltransferase [Muribaculaceae bacterium]